MEFKWIPIKILSDSIDARRVETVYVKYSWLEWSASVSNALYLDWKIMENDQNFEKSKSKKSIGIAKNEMFRVISLSDKRHFLTQSHCKQLSNCI